MQIYVKLGDIFGLITLYKYRYFGCAAPNTREIHTLQIVQYSDFVFSRLTVPRASVFACFLFA